MYPEAEAFYQRALALEERVLGSDASGLLALDSLADFYYERRQLAQAEQLYKRVISIKAGWSRDHGLLYSPVAQLRDIYIAQKQFGGPSTDRPGDCDEERCMALTVSSWATHSTC